MGSDKENVESQHFCTARGLNRLRYEEICGADVVPALHTPLQIYSAGPPYLYCLDDHLTKKLSKVLLPLTLPTPPYFVPLLLLLITSIPLPPYLTYYLLTAFSPFYPSYWHFLLPSLLLPTFFPSLPIISFSYLTPLFPNFLLSLPITYFPLSPFSLSPSTSFPLLSFYPLFASLHFLFFFVPFIPCFFSFPSPTFLPLFLVPLLPPPSLSP